MGFLFSILVAWMAHFVIFIKRFPFFHLECACWCHYGVRTKITFVFCSFVFATVEIDEANAGIESTLYFLLWMLFLWAAPGLYFLFSHKVFSGDVFRAIDSETKAVLSLSMRKLSSSQFLMNFSILRRWKIEIFRLCVFKWTDCYSFTIPSHVDFIGKWIHVLLNIHILINNNHMLCDVLFC